VADRVNLGLIPSSDAGWRTACAALTTQTGGVLHVHATVTSNAPDQQMRDSSTYCKISPAVTRTISDQGQTGSCTDVDDIIGTLTLSDNLMSVGTVEAKTRMSKFAKTRAAKPSWLDWANTACETLQCHLTEMMRCDWSVSVLHIEHVKSYAPHVDHIVADIDCRPPSFNAYR